MLLWLAFFATDSESQSFRHSKKKAILDVFFIPNVALVDNFESDSESQSSRHSKLKKSFWMFFYPKCCFGWHFWSWFWKPKKNLLKFCGWMGSFFVAKKVPLNYCVNFVKIASWRLSVLFFFSIGKPPHPRLFNAAWNKQRVYFGDVCWTFNIQGMEPAWESPTSAPVAVCKWSCFLPGNVNQNNRQTIGTR